jgi:hypothetical protein
VYAFYQALAAMVGGPVGVLVAVLVTVKLWKDLRAPPPEEVDWSVLPRRSTEEPLRAWKVAYLVLLDDRVVFRAVTRPLAYGPDQPAICHVLFSLNLQAVPPAKVPLIRFPSGKVFHHGPVPDLACTCGFYALTGATRRLRWARVLRSAWASRLARARRVQDQVLAPAVLDVELLGRVVVYERGYRASHQRVLSAAVDARCFACGHRATGFGAPALTGNGNNVPLRSTCGCRMPVRWSLQDVCNLVGTEVRWDPDRKPLLTMRRRRA